MKISDQIKRASLRQSPASKLRKAGAIGLGDALDTLTEAAKETLNSLQQDEDVEHQALVELRNMIQALARMDKGLVEMSQAWRVVQATHKNFDKGYVTDPELNKAFEEMKKVALPNLD